MLLSMTFDSPNYSQTLLCFWHVLECGLFCHLEEGQQIAGYRSGPGCLCQYNQLVDWHREPGPGRDSTLPAPNTSLSAGVRTSPVSTAGPELSKLSFGSWPVSSPVSKRAGCHWGSVKLTMAAVPPAHPVPLSGWSLSAGG